MSNRLDPVFVRAQIEVLRRTHPDIWEDEDDRLLALESETELREFLAKVVDRMQDAQAMGEGIDELFKLWKARLARFEQRIDAMRALAFNLMTAAEVRKVELPAATLSIRAGVPRVILADNALDLLPPDCIRTKREPNLVEIGKRLKNGETINGAVLSNAEETLAMRIK